MQNLGQFKPEEKAKLAEQKAKKYNLKYSTVTYAKKTGDTEAMALRGNRKLFL